jgi:hypothetical protein
MDEKKMPYIKGKRHFSQQYKLLDMLLPQIMEILDEAGTEFSEENERVKSFFLLEFSEKDDVLQQVLMEKTSDILAAALMRLQLLLNSMQMPLSQLDSSLQALKARIREAEQQKITAGDLLAGDRKRLANYLEEQAAWLNKEARAHLLSTVEAYLKRCGDNLKEDRLVRELNAEISVFFEAKLKIEADAFNQRVTEVLGDYQKRADDIMETVRRSAIKLFAVTYQVSNSSEAYKLKKEPFLFKTLDSKLSPIPKTIVGSVLPAKKQRTMIRKHYSEKIDKLVINNVENLRWSALKHVDHLFRTFGTIFDQRLQATIDSTYGALQGVWDKRSGHTRPLLPEITKLQDIKVKLEKIKRKIKYGDTMIIIDKQ